MGLFINCLVRSVGAGPPTQPAQQGLQRTGEIEAWLILSAWPATPTGPPAAETAVRRQEAASALRGSVMKHERILRQLVTEAERDPNVLGFLVFGSVATSTHREDSDIDLITVLQTNRPTSGIDNTQVEGIKVGTIFFTYDILRHSIKTVPYLLHPLCKAKLLFDRADMIKPLLETIQVYFAEHPEIEKEWDAYYRQLREEKAQFGFEKTTIIDVWNELENRYSGRKTKRHFFSAFYLTNPRIFSLLKRFL